MELQIYTEEDKNRLLGFINLMKYPYKIKMDGIFPNRSVQQNRYYWNVVSKVADHLGLTQREAHHLLLKEFATVEEYEDDGEIKVVVESTTSMSTMRMEQYLESIRRWMLTIHGLYIGMPNEYFEETELKIKEL